MATYIAEMLKEPSDRQLSPLALKQLQSLILDKQQEEHRLLRKKLAARAYRLRKFFRKKRERQEEQCHQYLRNNAQLYLSQVSKTIRTELEEECLALSLQLTKRFLEGSARTDKESLRNGLRAAFYEREQSELVHIFFHPDDRPHIEEIMESLHIDTLRLTADSTLQRGEARIKSKMGEFLIHWRAEYERIARNILLEYARRRASNEHSPR
ncbi:MAG: FliH/SctL family protein [Bdellovibrionota bacterium]|jgi:flagellar biosynthesis/type III secretory pathway protein FliH